MNDGTSGGERIGCRSRRRRYDQPISPIPAHELFVDNQFQLNHPRKLTFMNHGFIDNALAINEIPVTLELNTKHDALADGEFPRHSLFEGGIEFLELETSEETEAAHVDGKNGNTERGGDAGSGEQSAVAP